MIFTTETLISFLKEKYGDKYDYSEVVYNGSQNKIRVICKKHGVFDVRIDKIKIHDDLCGECRKEKVMIRRQNEYIKKAKEIHGDKYDYSKIEIRPLTKNVTIICPKHGEFQQTLINHVCMKQGCVKCYRERQIGVYKIGLQEFIEEAKKVHGDYYDYSQTIYNGKKEKLKIICPVHGEFWQVAYDHLRGFKCEKCKYDKNTLTVETFIEKARKIHGDKYDYSKIVYINNHTKVNIICPIHGEFQQTPSAHLLGCGCQKCGSSRMERTIRFFLEKHDIVFIEQYRAKWLGKQSLDFYLPDYNIAIECQGKQHVDCIQFFKTNSQKERERDIRKSKKCLKNGVKLFYLCEKRYENIFLTDKELYSGNLISLRNPYKINENEEKALLCALTNI